MQAKDLYLPKSPFFDTASHVTLMVYSLPFVSMMQMRVSFDYLI